MQPNSRRICFLALSLALASAAVWLTPSPAWAICDVIPQTVTVFQGETGALDRVYASPGDRIAVTIDQSADGCEAGAADLDGVVPAQTFDSFDADIDGWTDSSISAMIEHEIAGGSPGGWLHGTRGSFFGTYYVLTPAQFGGDWAARGVSQISLDYQIVDLCGGAPINGLRGIVQLATTSGITVFEYQIDPSAQGFVEGSWVHFDIPVDPANPGSWVAVSGLPSNWANFLMHDVGEVRIRGSLVGGTSCDESGIDDFTVTEDKAPAHVATILFTPPSGLPSAVVVTPGACETLASELADCAADLGGGTVACVGLGPVTVAPDRFSFPFPDTDALVGGVADGVGLTGPATIAVSPSNSLPCELASLRCSDPGAPADLRACIDEFYARDGTCTADPVQRHAQFPAFTALPSPNDFAELCSSIDPDSPCQGSKPDFGLAVDVEGNALIPMGWSRVLVPGEIPIPRIVSGDTLFEAFDSDATPGTDPPVAIPGGSFLSSYSPRGQRVAPLFSPIGDPSDSSRLLGSVDAERGVIRIARRGERFQACDGGDRDGLPCNFDVECPNGGSCGAGTCQGGTSAGKVCNRDLQCPGSECGPSLFDLTDRMFNGVGPISIPGADYDAEARNPVAIDALLETAAAVVTVRSEALEGNDADANQLPDGADLNGDGDASDRSVLTLRRKADDTDVLIGPGGSVGDAVVRTRAVGQPGQQGLQTFAVTGLSVEADLIAFLSSEAQDDVGANGDGDFFDYPVNVLRAPDFLPVNEPAVADPELRISGRSIVVSAGQVFWRQPEADDASQVTSQLDVDAFGTPANSPASSFDLTPDGRFAAFASQATNLVPGGSDSSTDIFVHDRDADGDGLLDEAGAIDTIQVSLTSLGADPSASSFEPRISADGRYVVFASFHDLLGLGVGSAHIYLYDRDSDANSVFDEPAGTETRLMTMLDDGTPFNGGASGGNVLDPDVSADGRFVVWTQKKDPLTGGPLSEPRIAVHDRDADEDGLFDDEGDGYDPGEITVFFVEGAAAPNGLSTYPVISEDGGWIAFISGASNLTGLADDNGTFDAFVVESVLGATPIRVSETTLGEEFDNRTDFPVEISADGRRVLMTTQAQNVEQPQGVTTTFIRDRDADEDGIFDEPGAVANRTAEMEDYDNSRGGLKGEGLFAGLIVHDIQGSLHNWGRFDVRTGVFGLSGDLDEPGGIPSLRSVTADASGRDVVRKVSGTGLLTTRPDLDPASPGNASRDLNVDGDLEDTLLRVLDGTDPVTPIGATTLGPASDVAVSDGIAAFLMPEAQVGTGTDLDGDGFDPEDEVVHLWTGGPAATNLGRAATALALSADYLAVIDADTGNVIVTPVVGAPSWVDLGVQGVDASLAVVGNRVAFVDPFGQVYIWEAGTGFLLSPNYTVADVVLGDSVAAFRVLESIHGDKNQDGDSDDAVMHVVDLAADQAYNTEFASIPCPVEACDPNRPYTVSGMRVRFLTLEPDQDPSPIGCTAVLGGCDLDGDGLGAGLVLQHFNLDAVLAGSNSEEATHAVAKTATGICTDTAEACVDDVGCPAGDCFVPPGGCIRDLGSACTFSAVLGGGDSCPGDEFCVPVAGMPGSATCQVREGPCSSDAQCVAPAFCVNDDQNAQRLVSAVEGGGDGGELLVSSGKCLDPTSSVCTTMTDCDADEICDDGFCHVVGGTCKTSANCDTGFTCENKVTVVASGDLDGDGLADVLDNCAEVANADQMDADGDGIGDACDRQTCGDGVQSYAEGCDDGNTTGGDGCDDTCQIEGPTPACGNGLDDDGDGDIDFGNDAGCTDAADTSERGSKACDDGLDNDGDFGIDFPDDPGCKNTLRDFEDPQCDDDLNNDGDGLIDWDGGPDGGAPDPQCVGKPWRNQEKKTGCGLGFELVFALGVLAVARRMKYGEAAG